VPVSAPVSTSRPATTEVRPDAGWS
jgi:hypothetical protein